VSFSADPIRVHPRLLPRRWGRERASSWCAEVERPSLPIGEIWLAHPYNTTANGVHFGALLAQDPQTMLGDLGRAPPALRLVITDEPSDPIASDAPVALWRMMECPLDAVINVYERQDAPARSMRCRRADLLRTNSATRLIFPGGVTALEARASFSPSNEPVSERVQRVLAANEKKHRAAWLRDPAMSVELWTLPEVSFVEPDGETCHLLMALSPGVAFDGAPLSRGDAVFLPAEGRRATLTGKGAQVAVAYPDLVPTQIWKHVHAPKPAALALDPALVERAEMGLAAHARDGVVLAAA
jgi:hypothetical protein